jgi:hypothetical protein
MILTDDLTREQLDRVAEIVREDLAEGFGDKFVFDPIWVIPEVDDHLPEDPMDYVQILIVFDGDQDNLDPSWTVGMIRRMRPKLIDAGVSHFPINSFIEKSEWEQYARKGWKKYLAGNKR